MVFFSKCRGSKNHYEGIAMQQSRKFVVSRLKKIWVKYTSELQNVTFFFLPQC
jgi:hypothetical protein